MANTVIASTADANMVDEPLWMQATGGDAAINYSSADFRSALDTLYAVEGVTTLTGFKLSQRGAGANFSVDCAAGKAVVIGDDGANQRKYIVVSNGTVNIATPSAPGAGTRVHRVIIRIRDKQVIGSGTYDWTLELLEDTGSGTPALPNSAINLGTVSIAAGQASVLNANITDTRALATVSAQGVVKRHKRTSGTAGTTGEIDVLRIDGAQVFAGHAYRITVSNAAVAATVANDVARWLIHFTTDGTSAVQASTTLSVSQISEVNTSFPAVVPFVCDYYPATTHLLSVILTLARMAGTGTVAAAGSATIPIIVTIEDMGVDPGNGGTDL